MSASPEINDMKTLSNPTFAYPTYKSDEQMKSHVKAGYQYGLIMTSQASVVDQMTMFKTKQDARDFYKAEKHKHEMFLLATHDGREMVTIASGYIK